jgi:hypothetical protein
MYYLEDLNLKDIKLLNQLLEDYREKNTMFEDGLPLPLPPSYHILKEKIKRLTKYASFNPNETDTPKQASKYSEFKKRIKQQNNLKKTYKLRKQNNETIKNT